jgi:hypothetical protein
LRPARPTRRPSASWVPLVATGAALVVSPHFRIAPEWYATLFERILGGRASLLTFPEEKQLALRARREGAFAAAASVAAPEAKGPEQAPSPGAGKA